MCESPPRAWLLFALSVWLLLTTARQFFDLIGKLWIPVAFNMLQMIFCITGLFAACQYRMCLLVALTISSVFSAAYNIFIILWYNNVFGDCSRPLLSAGLPYSYSFFVRHTPMCQSHFNLSSSRWVQSPCAVPFHQVESLQAFLHLILATITIVLSALVLYNRKHTKRCSTGASVRHPKITVEYAGAPIDSTLHPKAPNTAHPSADTNGGFLNSSYNDVLERDTEHRTIRRTQPTYIRQSARTPGTRAPRPLISLPVLQQPGSDAQLATSSVLDAAGRCSGRLSRNANIETNESKYAEGQWSDYEDPYAKPRTRSASVKSFKMAATQGVRRIFSHEQLAEDGVLERDSVGRVSGSNFTALVSFDPKSNTLIRVREHVDDESDEEIYEGGLSSAFPHNTLVPTVNAPPPPLPSTSRPTELSGSDSGVPSSSSAPTEWTPSSAFPGYTIVGKQSPWQDPLPPPPVLKPRTPIGYEPALCEPPPPPLDNDLCVFPSTQFIYEPLYKRTAQVCSPRKNNIGHYHDPNSLRLMAYESEPRGAPATVPIINNNSLLV